MDELLGLLIVVIWWYFKKAILRIIVRILIIIEHKIQNWVLFLQAILNFWFRIQALWRKIVGSLLVVNHIGFVERFNSWFLWTSRSALTHSGRRYSRSTRSLHFILENRLPIHEILLLGRQLWSRWLRNLRRPILTTVKDFFFKLLFVLLEFIGFLYSFHVFLHTNRVHGWVVISLKFRMSSRSWFIDHRLESQILVGHFLHLFLLLHSLLFELFLFLPLFRTISYRSFRHTTHVWSELLYAWR